MATGNNLFISVSPIVQKLILTSGVAYSAQSLSSRLCAAAERLSLSHDYVSLSQVADLLSTIPHGEAQVASLFYRAIIERSNGREESAARLLEGILSAKAATKYQVRAIQALGAVHRFTGDRREAARLYNQAIERSSADLSTLVNGVLARSELASAEGNHERAVADLCAVRPAVELLARVHPVYAPIFANEIAFELAQLGKVDEARRFAAYAVASPLAPRFPAWAETAQEIEQQAREKAARNRIQRPAVKQARKTSPKSKLRLVEKPCLGALPASTQRRTGPVGIIRPEPPRSRPTLEQICLTARIRAPSF